MDVNIRLTQDMNPKTDDERMEMKKVPYQQAIGYLATTTRPNIFSTLSQFSNYPETAH